MRVRSDPQPSPEHLQIAQQYMAGRYDGQQLSPTTKRALHTMGLLAPGNQQRQQPAAPVQQHAAVVAPQPPIQHQHHGAPRKGSIPSVAAAPAAPSALPPPTVPVVQPSMGVASGPIHQPTPIHVVPISRLMAYLPPPAAQPLAAAQVIDYGPVRAARPAPAPVTAAPRSAVTAPKDGKHVAIKDAPSPNVPFPNADITIVEIMAFAPQWLRSVDLINRVYQNHGGQNALANMVCAHRKNSVTANTIWKLSLIHI